MRISDWSSDVCSSDLWVGTIWTAFGTRWPKMWCSIMPRHRTRPTMASTILRRSLAVRRFWRRSARISTAHYIERDRKRGVEGKRVSGRVDLGGGRIIEKKNKKPRQIDKRTSTTAQP